MSDENGSSAQYPFTALQALELAKVYLENACSTTDTDIALALCQDVETSLLKSEHDAKPSQDHLVLKAIGTEYARLANLLRGLGRQDEAQASQRKAEELGVHTREQDSVGSSPESPVDKSPITWRNLAKDPLVLQRLADRVRHEPSFKQELLDYIERSKEDKQWRVAAANAITILVLAGVQFNHADLRGIRIPNADLTYGVFESAQLQGADLRNVSLCGTWLRNANMSQARMMGVQFGERPSLSDSGYICVPSPDDTTLSIVAEEAIIHVYSTSTWERIWTLEGHTLDINVIVYSPNGNQLASGANDNTVRLWDIKSGSCSYVLRCHDARGSRRRRVHSVAYSPGGDQVATAGTNLVIQLWDTSSGECLYFLIGHPSTIKCVIYSQTGNSIVSSAANGTIRQWNLNTSKHPRFIRGHLDGVEMLLLSPQGNRLVSSSYDRSVRVWNMSTGKCLLTFAGMNHASAIRYSPRDEQVAIAGEDDTIYLWDTLSGAQLALEGHSGCIFDIAYSPKGDLLASCSHDGTVRLWDTVSGICRQTITGEPDTFQFICFSLKGDFIITGDEKTAIRLFDVASTRSRRILDCHHDQATKVVYSPNGNQVATCGADKTIKLWDSDSGECLYTLHGHTS
ncbi:WD domain protein, partial [Mortierella sp. GBA43]